MENPEPPPYNRNKIQAGPGSDMAKIEIYTTALCPFCYRAKHLLEKKGVEFTEIDVTFSRGQRAKMTERAGSRAVPQIWIDNQHIGGSDELYALDAQGSLDGLLWSTK